jgi:hypothetical protein
MQTVRFGVEPHFEATSFSTNPGTSLMLACIVLVATCKVGPMRFFINRRFDTSLQGSRKNRHEQTVMEFCLETTTG